jgi:hypothetical protein
MDNKTVIIAHKTTHLRRKAGEFKGKKCAVQGCDEPEKMEHHPDYTSPAFTIPACCTQHHNLLSD